MAILDVIKSEVIKPKATKSSILVNRVLLQTLVKLTERNHKRSV